MRALVTGCAGFIGSHLARALAEDGWEVAGIDSMDPYYSVAIKRRNVDSLIREFGLAFVEGDVNDPAALDRAFDPPPDVVVHLAAKVGVHNSLADPAGYARTNVAGTLAVLEAARRAGVGRVTFASSSSVYGDTSTPPYREDDPNLWPVSPYGMTKLHGENYARQWCQLYDMEVNALRFFTVYGPGQREDMAIHQFIRRIGRGEPIDMYGDGQTYRDYTYIGDMIRGVRAAMERFRGFRTYNLGSGRPVRLREMIDTIGEIMGREPVIHKRPIPLGDMRATHADIDRARTELGYEPAVPFREGVAREVEWIADLVARGIVPP